MCNKSAVGAGSSLHFLQLMNYFNASLISRKLKGETWNHHICVLTNKLSRKRLNVAFRSKSFKWLVSISPTMTFIIWLHHFIMYHGEQGPQITALKTVQ